MKINVQCTSKNERLEGNSTIADITLSPVGDTALGTQSAAGAVVGTPNAPQTNTTENLQQTQQVQYNMNGALSFVIRDEEEAQNFKVGQRYTITVGVESASQQTTTKQPAK